MSIAAETRPAISNTTSFAVKLKAYVALTKPRIIEQLLITTVPPMIVAEKGMPSIWLILATVIGGTLAAGGANAVNMWWDRDIDAVMKRTSRRPLVQGTVTPRAALTFAISIEVIAFAWLALFVNLLSAALALSAMLFYVFIYTLWLKRTTSNNIVIGGAAGCVPVLVGWAAVTNSIAIAPFVMFAIIFMWTPPHTWALAYKYREDYRSADVPMLPVVASMADTSRQIMVYTLLLWALTLILVPIAQMGFIYGITAIITGALFTYFALRLQREETEKAAMRLFHWSITYLTVLFAAMAADPFLTVF